VVPWLTTWEIAMKLIHVTKASVRGRIGLFLIHAAGLCDALIYTLSFTYFSGGLRTRLLFADFMDHFE